MNTSITSIQNIDTFIQQIKEMWSNKASNMVLVSLILLLVLFNLIFETCEFDDDTLSTFDFLLSNFFL